MYIEMFAHSLTYTSLLAIIYNTYLYKYDNCQLNNDLKVHLEMTIHLTSKMKYYMSNLLTKKNPHT